MVQQFIHGTRYIDQLVLMRAKAKGDLFVHQDANWNVIGLTDLDGRLVERYEYTPYGEPTAPQVRADCGSKTSEFVMIARVWSDNGGGYDNYNVDRPTGGGLALLLVSSSYGK